MLLVTGDHRRKEDQEGRSEVDLWWFRNAMDGHGLSPDPLWVEGVVSILLRREGVGLDLVLLLLSHKITL